MIFLARLSMPLVIASLFVGCLTDLSVPASTEISCKISDDCPSDWICLESTQLCAKALPTVPPTLSITPLNRAATVPVEVCFMLSDPGGGTASVLLEVTTGDDWVLGTVASASAGTVAGDSVVGLTTSSVATSYCLMWDTRADLGPGAHPDVRLRLTPSDADGIGNSEWTPAFAAGNDAPAVVILRPSMQQQITGLVQIRYSARDSTSDPISVITEYSANGVDGPWVWYPATLASRAVADVPTSVGGVTHDLFWDAIADFGNVNASAVVVRITPSDGYWANPPPVGASSEAFRLENNSAPIALFEGIPHQDSTGQVPVPFRLIDAEGDPVSVLIQWQTGAAPFPELPGVVDDLLGRAALLANPAQRAALHIITEGTALARRTVASSGLSPSSFRTLEPLPAWIIPGLPAQRLRASPEIEVVASGLANPIGCAFAGELNPAPWIAEVAGATTGDAVLSHDGGTLYFTDAIAGLVVARDLATAVDTTVANGLSSPVGIDLDGSNALVIAEKRLVPLPPAIGRDFGAEPSVSAGRRELAYISGHRRPQRRWTRRFGECE